MGLSTCILDFWKNTFQKPMCESKRLSVLLSYYRICKGYWYISGASCFFQLVPGKDLEQQVSPQNVCWVAGIKEQHPVLLTTFSQPKLVTLLITSSKVNILQGEGRWGGGYHLIRQKLHKASRLPKSSLHQAKPFVSQFFPEQAWKRASFSCS